MTYTYKEWLKEEYYNFSIEFNRIESYNEYCKKWLNYFGIVVTFDSNTNWNINDIVDIKDYNRVKTNINILLNAIQSDTTRLNIREQYNQVWNVTKANELEIRLKENLKKLGEWQFSNEITGIAITGNNLRLGGVL